MGPLSLEFEAIHRVDASAFPPHYIELSVSSTCGHTGCMVFWQSAKIHVTRIATQNTLGVDLNEGLCKYILPFHSEQDGVAQIAVQAKRMSAQLLEMPKSPSDSSGQCHATPDENQATHTQGTTGDVQPSERLGFPSTDRESSLANVEGSIDFLPELRDLMDVTGASKTRENQQRMEDNVTRFKKASERYRKQVGIAVTVTQNVNSTANESKDELSRHRQPYNTSKDELSRHRQPYNTPPSSEPETADGTKGISCKRRNASEVKELWPQTENLVVPQTMETDSVSPEANISSAGEETGTSDVDMDLPAENIPPLPKIPRSEPSTIGEPNVSSCQATTRVKSEKVGTT